MVRIGKYKIHVPTLWCTWKFIKIRFKFSLIDSTGSRQADETPAQEKPNSKVRSRSIWWWSMAFCTSPVLVVWPKPIHPLPLAILASLVPLPLLHLLPQLHGPSWIAPLLSGVSHTEIIFWWWWWWWGGGWWEVDVFFFFINLFIVCMSFLAHIKINVSLCK